MTEPKPSDLSNPSNPPSNPLQNPPSLPPKDLEDPIIPIIPTKIPVPTKFPFISSSSSKPEKTVSEPGWFNSIGDLVGKKSKTYGSTVTTGGTGGIGGTTGGTTGKKAKSVVSAAGSSVGGITDPLYSFMKARSPLGGNGNGDKDEKALKDDKRDGSGGNDEKENEGKDRSPPPTFSQIYPDGAPDIYTSSALPEPQVVPEGAGATGTPATATGATGATTSKTVRSVKARSTVSGSFEDEKKEKKDGDRTEDKDMDGEKENKEVEGDKEND
ncbi:hypothetical protein J3R30DRAFT_1848145 [Lentinula aciculospora]|uniref:Uncharacterized protein n=1 Tax=Lentinula aciculospora TaxID=153920 RepID=A0A9W9AIY8_9AGAR|nr:hypothetical protein J3R30DRAFT_1848145 [Lentinula aciculospora]